MTQLETIQQHFRTLRMPTAVQIVAETVAVAQRFRRAAFMSGSLSCSDKVELP